MHDPALMSVRDNRQHLRGQLAERSLVQPTPTVVDQHIERRAFDKFHFDEWGVAVHPVSVHRHDAVMVQLLGDGETIGSIGGLARRLAWSTQAPFSAPRHCSPPLDRIVVVSRLRWRRTSAICFKPAPAHRICVALVRRRIWVPV